MDGNELAYLLLQEHNRKTFFGSEEEFLKRTSLKLRSLSNMVYELTKENKKLKNESQSTKFDSKAPLKTTSITLNRDELKELIKEAQIEGWRNAENHIYTEIYRDGYSCGDYKLRDEEIINPNEVELTIDDLILTKFYKKD